MLQKQRNFCLVATVSGHSDLTHFVTFWNEMFHGFVSCQIQWSNQTDFIVQTSAKGSKLLENVIVVIVVTFSWGSPSPPLSALHVVLVSRDFDLWRISPFHFCQKQRDVTMWRGLTWKCYCCSPTSSSSLSISLSVSPVFSSLSSIVSSGRAEATYLPGRSGLCASFCLIFCSLCLFFLQLASELTVYIIWHYSHVFCS